MDEAFFDSAGWGLSARVLGVRNEDRRTVEQLGPLKAFYRDHLVYAGAFARTFLASYVDTDKFSAAIVADGAPRRLDGASKALLHVDGNPLTEQALNAVGIEHSRGFRFGSLTMRLEPVGSIPVAAQIDGEEVAPHVAVAIENVPRALRLVVPRR